MQTTPYRLLSNAPSLGTERLRLRAHSVADLPQYAAMWADESVTRFIGGKPLTEEEAWLRLLRHAGHWSLLGFGYWVVEEKATGTLLGEAGLADFHRDIDPPIYGIRKQAGSSPRQPMARAMHARRCRQSSRGARDASATLVPYA